MAEPLVSPLGLQMTPALSAHERSGKTKRGKDGATGRRHKGEGGAKEGAAANEEAERQKNTNKSGQKEQPKREREG